MVYFDNHEHSGLFTSLLCSSLTDVPQECGTVRTPSMGVVLTVHHSHPASAVISAIRKSSRLYFKLLMRDQRLSFAGQR